MGIRTGAQYIEGLKDGRSLYIAGELVRDVTTYAPLQGIIRTMAEHFDAFHDPRLQPKYTFASPKDGKPVSNSFEIATSVEQIQRRVEGETLRKEATFGLMGRLPDFMNAFMTDIAMVAPHVLGHKDKQFGENAIAYWEYCRDNDICLTHTLVDPKRDYSKDVMDSGTVKIVKESDAGIYVTGARMLSTLAPVSDELFVGAFMPRRPGEEKLALSFAVPVATPGLKFIARESYARGRSTYDRPLSERYDEGDALAIFDNMFIPWERVFVAGDLLAHNTMMSMYPGYLGLQANIRGRGKLRFMTGLASKMANVIGRSEIQRYQEMLGELIALNELADALVDACAVEVANRSVQELARQTDPSFDLGAMSQKLMAVFGSPGESNVAWAMLRFFVPQVNTKVNDVIRLLGSSSLVLTATEADFANPDIAQDLETYMSGAGVSARERIQVMKLAWDAVASEFGGRQEIYEIFFAGDPALAKQLFYRSPKRMDYEALVDKLLTKK